MINQPRLILVRHGQSVWNLENKFTGWVDVDLSEKGIEEAKLAGEKLKGFKLDQAFTSELIRAKHTLNIILSTLNQCGIPVEKNKALNERMYGELEGLNKEEVKSKYGEVQFNRWRRSFLDAPPGGESLKMTQDRVLPYYQSYIRPCLILGETILVVAHGNSLRALMMYLENLTESQIENTEIITGMPRWYRYSLEGQNLNLEGIYNL